MSRTETPLLTSFILFIFLIAVGVVVAIWTQQPTPAAGQASAEELKETSVNSSHADKKLSLRVTQKPGGMTEYSYIISDVSGENRQVIFEKTLPADSSMKLPDNSWDPSDTYVFVEQITGGVPNYYVMKSTGGSVIDVGAVWNDKKIPYTIRTATGWASDTLLIIYTSKDDGSHGPAFWFEIPGTAILQLAA